MPCDPYHNRYTLYPDVNGIEDISLSYLKVKDPKTEVGEGQDTHEVG